MLLWGTAKKEKFTPRKYRVVEECCALHARAVIIRLQTQWIACEATEQWLQCFNVLNALTLRVSVMEAKYSLKKATGEHLLRQAILLNATISSKTAWQQLQISPSTVTKDMLDLYVSLVITLEFSGIIGKF